MESRRLGNCDSHMKIEITQIIDHADVGSLCVEYMKIYGQE